MLDKFVFIGSPHNIENIAITEGRALARAIVSNWDIQYLHEINIAYWTRQSDNFSSDLWWEALNDSQMVDKYFKAYMDKRFTDKNFSGSAFAYVVYNAFVYLNYVLTTDDESVLNN